MPYITRDFPIEFVNAIVHKEVQGKKPIYNLHRWWARRLLVHPTTVGAR